MKDMTILTPEVAQPGDTPAVQCGAVSIPIDGGQNWLDLGEIVGVQLVEVQRHDSTAYRLALTLRPAAGVLIR